MDRVTEREVKVTGIQVLVGLVAALCLVGALVWAFVRYWLFAP